MHVVGVSSKWSFSSFFGPPLRTRVRTQAMMCVLNRSFERTTQKTSGVCVCMCVRAVCVCVCFQLFRCYPSISEKCGCHGEAHDAAQRSVQLSDSNSLRAIRPFVHPRPQRRSQDWSALSLSLILSLSLRLSLSLAFSSLRYSSNLLLLFFSPPPCYFRFTSSLF